MTPSAEKPFRLGIVEGFFGLPWSWQARTDYAGFSRHHGFNTYLYAPKSDRLLRQDWKQPFPQDHLDNLSRLAVDYRNLGLDFGIGLSPFELYRDFSTTNQQLLREKISQINSINPGILCILFDDMQGDFASLAEQQARITEFILEQSQASQFIFCPTYYSDDPRLVAHFGEMPDHYLEDIGSLLPAGIDIFWTGPKVFSEIYTPGHLQKVAEKFRRKPLIWDNYPVNDAASLTDYLHLNPFNDHSRVLQEYASGHLANPMNQAYLSQLPLYTLSRHYQKNGLSASSLEAACQALCSAPLAEQILADAACFQHQGLKELNDETRRQLVEKYEAFGDDPMAVEIRNWLNGVYEFDPDCLT